MSAFLVRFLLCFVITLPAFAQKAGIYVLNSSDNRYTAKIINVISNLQGESHGYVLIFHQKHPINALHFETDNYGMPQLVNRFQWSPDSMYFVCLSEDIDGHHCWESFTSIYDVRHNRFVLLDDKIGPVADDQIRFIGRHTLKIHFNNDDDGKFEKISLDKVCGN